VLFAVVRPSIADSQLEPEAGTVNVEGNCSEADISLSTAETDGISAAAVCVGLFAFLFSIPNFAQK